MNWNLNCISYCGSRQENSYSVDRMMFKMKHLIFGSYQVSLIIISHFEHSFLLKSCSCASLNLVLQLKFDLDDYFQHILEKLLIPYWVINSN